MAHSSGAGSSSRNPPKLGVVDDFRRKFDIADYQHQQHTDKRQNDERKPKYGGPSDEPEDPNAPKIPVRAREYKVDLESKLGKTVVVTKESPMNQQGGYY